MFLFGIRSDISMSINNESSLKLHLNSFLILMLTSLLTPSRNIPSVLQSVYTLLVDNLGYFHLYWRIWSALRPKKDLEPDLVTLSDSGGQLLDNGASRSSYIERLLPLWPPPRFGPLPLVWPELSNTVDCTHCKPRKKPPKNQTQILLHLLHVLIITFLRKINYTWNNKLLLNEINKNSILHYESNNLAS